MIQKSTFFSDDRRDNFLIIKINIFLIINYLNILYNFKSNNQMLQFYF